MSCCERVQVCSNGHVVLENKRVSASADEALQAFCAICGEGIERSCLHCKQEIMPVYVEERCKCGGGCHPLKVKLPVFCHCCGKSHVWMDRTVDAAVQIIEGEQVEDSCTREELVEIIKDTPKGKVLVKKLKCTISRLSKCGAEIIKETLAPVVTSVLLSAIGL